MKSLPVLIVSKFNFKRACAGNSLNKTFPWTPETSKKIERQCAIFITLCLIDSL